MRWDARRLGKEQVEGPRGGRVGGAVSAPSWLCPPADSRYLRQQAEVSVQNGAVGLLEEFLEAGPHEVECIGRGQLGKELVLLRLVVQDFGLRVAGGKKRGRVRRLCELHSPSHSPTATKP